MIRHLVMPNHVECCTAPVLAWLAEHMPDVPVNVMDQYHPDTFCDPRSQKYRPQYAELARRCTGEEIRSAYRHARARGLNFRLSAPLCGRLAASPLEGDGFAPRRQR
jgi:putative pyruvate formate lyase activating enzyme